MTKKILELVSGLLSGKPSLSGRSMKEIVMNATRDAANSIFKSGRFAGAVASGMKALSQAAGAMAQYGGKGNFGANALSFANTAGEKANASCR